MKEPNSWVSNQGKYLVLFTKLAKTLNGGGYLGARQWAPDHESEVPVKCQMELCIWLMDIKNCSGASSQINNEIEMFQHIRDYRSPGPQPASTKITGLAKIWNVSCYPLLPNLYKSQHFFPLNLDTTSESLQIQYCIRAISDTEE